MMAQDGIDQPRAVRSGEELDTTRLEAFLKAHMPAFSGLLTVSQFPAGYSNLTYHLQLGDQEYVLRRPAFGAQIKSGHDLSREYRILSHLHSIYQQAPRALLFCEDESVIGAPFYIMERVKGAVLRVKGAAELDTSPNTMRQLSEAF